jgi:hypothetical protein
MVPKPLVVVQSMVPCVAVASPLVNVYVLFEQMVALPRLLLSVMHQHLLYRLLSLSLYRSIVAGYSQRLTRLHGLHHRLLHDK